MKDSSVEGWHTASQSSAVLIKCSINHKHHACDKLDEYKQMPKEEWVIWRVNVIADSLTCWSNSLCRQSARYTRKVTRILKWALHVRTEVYVTRSDFTFWLVACISLFLLVLAHHDHLRQLGPLYLSPERKALTQARHLFALSTIVLCVFS